MSTYFFPAFLAFGLVACAGADADTDTGFIFPPLSDTDTETDTDTEVDTDPEVDSAFLPTEGIWTVQSAETTLDECGLEDASERGQPGSTLELTGFADDFSMLFEAGETVNCVADDALAFDCEITNTLDSTATDMGFKADILVGIHSYGNFEGESTLWMESMVDIDCAGEDCPLIELLLGTRFPCSMAMASDVTAN
jgi:hypothetical protein